MTLPSFDDPDVRTVYELLCRNDLTPPIDEHWEGFLARLIVKALRQSSEKKDKIVQYVLEYSYEAARETALDLCPDYDMEDGKA